MTNHHPLKPCPECGKMLKHVNLHLRSVHKKKAVSSTNVTTITKTKEHEYAPEERVFDNATAWAFGHCEHICQEAAGRIGVPVAAIAQRVSWLLQRSQSGEVLGSINRMPAMRSKAA